MEKFFRSDNETWIAIQTNMLFIAAVEFLIYNGGLMIKYAFQRQFDFMTPLVGEKFGPYYNANFWIIIPILMTLAFMYFTCPGALRVFTEGSFAGKMKALGKGFLLGIIAIAILSFFAAVSKTVTFQYRGSTGGSCRRFCRCSSSARRKSFCFGAMCRRWRSGTIAGMRCAFSAVCCLSSTIS